MKRVLYYRQKLLLALIQAFGGSLSGVSLEKYLFLFTRVLVGNKSYDFIPYKKGCFSFQSYADCERLAQIGILQLTKSQWRISNSKDYLSEINIKEKLLDFADEHKKIKGDDLICKVYREYPYYAIKSQLIERLKNKGILSKADIQRINKFKPIQKNHAFFTIGYEGQSFESYLNKLIKNNIRILCDVRKNPLSRKYGFSKGILSKTLKSLGIEYVHIPELGIVSEKRQKLNSQADYDLLFDDYEMSTLKQNQPALRKLYNIFEFYRRVAITCFEADHCMCHRSRVANALSGFPNWKYKIKHI